MLFPLYFQVYHAKNIKFDIGKCQFELNSGIVCSQVTIFGPFWNASLSKSNWRTKFYTVTIQSLFFRTKKPNHKLKMTRSLRNFPPSLFLCFPGKNHATWTSNRLEIWKCHFELNYKIYKQHTNILTIEEQVFSHLTFMKCWLVYVNQIANKQLNSLCFRTKKPKYKLKKSLNQWNFSTHFKIKSDCLEP